MQRPESTCWTLVEDAATGDRAAREEFGRRYLPVVRAYLHARWSGRLSEHELEDALQDAFVALLGDRGVLEKLRPGRQEAFRPLLYAVVRNMALRIEHARVRKLDAAGSESFHPDEKPSTEASLSRVFDRAWAGSIVREALERQEELALAQGAEASKRFELLQQLFEEERSIPEIAAEWNVAADALHRDLVRAKREFKEALTEVVAFHHPHAPELVERECRELLALLD